MSRCSLKSRAWLQSWFVQQALSCFVCLASFGGEKRTTDVIHLLKEGKNVGDQACQPHEKGFAVKSSEDGDQIPGRKEELQMKEKHKEEGYKEVFHTPGQKEEHSEAALQ